MSRTTPLPRSVALVLLAALLVVAAVLSLSVGARAIGWGEVIGALTGRSHSADATVVTSQRVPRTVFGVLAGAALGTAGALMQGHTRNPLADPGLFGVNAGAALGVSALVFVAGISSPPLLVAAAMVGAAAATVLVTLLGMRNAYPGAMVLVALIGTATAALLSAVTTALILLDRQTLDVVRFWQVGSLANRDTALLPVVAVTVVVGLVLAGVNAFALNSLSLGEQVAQSLGVDVRRARLLGIVAITLLAGGATALCGPIGFLGLLAPHVARWLVGTDYRWVIPCSAALGVALTLGGDALGRLSAAGELEVGLMTAVIGAPALLVIARRRRLAAL